MCRLGTKDILIMQCDNVIIICHVTNRYLCARSHSCFEPAQMNGYVVEECLFSLLLQFENDLKCLHQLLDLLLALLQVIVC